MKPNLNLNLVFNWKRHETWSCLLSAAAAAESGCLSNRTDTIRIINIRAPSYNWIIRTSDIALKTIDALSKPNLTFFESDLGFPLWKWREIREASMRRTDGRTYGRREGKRVGSRDHLTRCYSRQQTVNNLPWNWVCFVCSYNDVASYQPHGPTGRCPMGYDCGTMTEVYK